MTLVEKLKEWYENETTPPHNMIEGVEYVTEKALEKKRWGVMTRYIYRDGDDYAAVEDVSPATEMQDWGDYGDPEIYEVEAVEVVTTEYVRKNGKA